MGLGLRVKCVVFLLADAGREFWVDSCFVLDCKDSRFRDLNYGVIPGGSRDPNNRVLGPQ